MDCSKVVHLAGPPTLALPIQPAQEVSAIAVAAAGVEGVTEDKRKEMAV